MRSDARLEECAGKRSIGTLTSPKLNMPDQKARPAPSPSPFVASCSGTEALLLLRPPAQLFQALFEGAPQVARGAPALAGRRLQALPLGLGGDQLAHALAVLVSKFARVKLASERLDELLGHPELTGVGGARHRRDLRWLQHLVLGVQARQHQVLAVGAQRAVILPLAHHPARQAHPLLFPEHARQGKVVLALARWAQEIRPLVPRRRDGALGHEARDDDVP